MDSSKWVKRAREKLGLTQQGLADVLGVNRVNVNRWENGKRQPSRMALNFLSHLLKTSGDILDEQEKR